MPNRVYRLVKSACWPLPVVDTNGAGDGLAVGFLSSYLCAGHSPAEAIRRGQIVARYTCAQRAPKAQLISAAELQHLAATATAQY